jgi:hypothetical protein
MKGTRTKAVKVEPIDAALLPTWYALPTAQRDQIRLYVLKSPQWGFLGDAAKRQARKAGESTTVVAWRKTADVYEAPKRRAR